MLVKRLMKKLMVALFVFTFSLIEAIAPIAVAEQPVVLELFTSQGCSSCPPADALLVRLAANPTVLPLSFHIDYWDRLGWKDPYSSPRSTDRQRDYAMAMGLNSVFTPQLIVDGAISVVGSNESEVREAIEMAGHRPHPVDIGILLNETSGDLNITVSGAKTSTAIEEADIFEIRFVSRAKTDVISGENRGRNLRSINNVTGIKLLGTWREEDSHYRLSPLRLPDDGIAIVVQMPHQDKILGSAVYSAHQ